MEFYQRIEVAEVCLPFEAAMWIAFGRVPPAHYDEDGIEIRACPVAVADGHIIGHDPYHPDEFLAAGVALDHGRYFDLLLSGASLSVDDYFNGSGNYLIAQGPLNKRGYDDAKFMKEVADAFMPYEAQAKTALLLALMQGRLTAHGYSLPHDDRDVYDDLWDDSPEPIAIPVRAWRDLPAIWSGDGSEIRLPGYQFAWIDTASVFREFPEPFLPSRKIGGVGFGATLVITSENVRSSEGRPRGRPRNTDDPVRKAVELEFTRRANRGELPEKQEAVYHECIQWVKRTFDKEISRSTAQRYLGACPK